MYNTGTLETSRSFLATVMSHEVSTTSKSHNGSIIVGLEFQSPCSYVGIGGPFRGDLMGRLENNFR